MKVRAAGITTVDIGDGEDGLILAAIPVAPRRGFSVARGL
jgi:hypothetical protein